MDVSCTAFRQLSTHLKQRRGDLLQKWRSTLQGDDGIATGNALPRGQLYDHVPAALMAFEARLRRLGEDGEEACASSDSIEAARAHGMHRWQQGYGLQEVVRELGHLNLILVAEMDAFADQMSMDPAVMATARQAWGAAYAAGIERSTSAFFELQQMEAAGHVKDLEFAVSQLTELEVQRATLWEQLAHDLRGNVGVVAAATRALTYGSGAEDAGNRFAQILERNVESLRHLLDDVTSLTRLQAGKEQRQVAPFDVSALLGQLCEGLQALAHQRHLYLRHTGPAQPLVVEGDAVKVRRLAQNLIINALKYTVHGGVEVAWASCAENDARRWILTVRDTGPGLAAGPGAPLASALQSATELSHDGDVAQPERTAPAAALLPAHQAHGEGIGLSIVKRLAELLDAAVEMESIADTGTTFSVFFPKRYSA